MPLLFPDLDQAMAQFEGYGIAGSLATVNNNPGNISYGSFAVRHGGTIGKGGFASFPSPEAGFAAQDALVSSYAERGSSIADLITAWSPPTGIGNSAESTQNYIDFVSSKLGVPPDTKLSDLKKTPESSNSDSMLSRAKDLGTKILFPWANLDWGKLGIFLLGLIAIAGGIYLMQPVRDRIIEAAKTASVAA